MTELNEPDNRTSAQREDAYFREHYDEILERHKRKVAEVLARRAREEQHEEN